MDSITHCVRDSWLIWVNCKLITIKQIWFSSLFAELDVKLCCLYEEMAFHNYRYMPCSNHLALLDAAITFLLMMFFCLFENTILEYRLLFYSLTLLLLSPGVQKALLHAQNNVSRKFIIDMQVWERRNMAFFSCAFI